MGAFFRRAPFFVFNASSILVNSNLTNINCQDAEKGYQPLIINRLDGYFQ